MSSFAASEQSVRLDVGDTWVLAVALYDDITGDPVDATVTATVTRPDTTTTNPTVTRQQLGLYTASYTLAAAGRHTGLMTSSGALVSVTDFSCLAETPSQLPTLADVKAYLASTGPTSYADADLTLALAAEAAAQAARCRQPAVYPADLREALLRRVARNLAARSVPVASFTAFDGGATSTRVPMLDAEITRLEAPWRRLTVR